MKKETLVSRPKSKNLPIFSVGLSKEEKERFVSQYNGCKDIRDILADIVQDKLDTAIKKAEKEDLYETPNWELHQADNRGYRRALREVYSLLTFQHLEVDHDR